MPREMAIRKVTSWWEGAEPIGFTRYAAAQLNVLVPVDDVTDREVAIVVRRAEVLATLIGLQRAKSNQAIRGAAVVSRN